MQIKRGTLLVNPHVLMRIFIVPLLFMSLQAAAAAEIHPFPQSSVQKAVELVREYLEGSGHKRTRLWNELRDLDPSGPVFVDETLKLIASDRSKWKSYSEARSSMLNLADNVVRESEPWKDFEGSPLKESIHKSAQSLLELLSNSSRHQDDLLTLFDRLELWSPADVRFLIQKSYAGHGISWRYFPRLVENFKDVSLEDRQYLLERTRKQSRRELAQYALAYQTGLMEPQDIVWLLRLFMDDGDPIRRASSMRGAPISGLTLMGVLGKLSEKEILARNGKVIEGLLRDVLQDLHTRLRAEDPLIKTAYDEIRARPVWPGLNLTESAKAAHMEFLRGLYTGQVLLDCDERLRAVEKDEKP